MNYRVHYIGRRPHPCFSWFYFHWYSEHKLSGTAALLGFVFTFARKD